MWYCRMVAKVSGGAVSRLGTPVGEKLALLSARVHAYAFSLDDRHVLVFGALALLESTQPGWRWC